MSLRRRLAPPSLVWALALGCVGWPPGEDPRGVKLLEMGARLVAAIEARRGGTGAYPSDLSFVAGRFDLERRRSDFRFEYAPVADGYRLVLDYVPSWPESGRVTCAYRPGTRWDCRSYL